jgi:prolyl-tRNA editing enzyme YbaK/EbsC (Cys-tRNA(Pro) deacylase)
MLMAHVQTACDGFELVYEVLACDPDLADTQAFCDHYGFTLQEAANTIIVSSKKVEPARLAVCVVLGTTKLDVNKAVCNELDVKRASFADAELTVAVSNMEIGGVTAVGIEGFPLLIDAAVMNQSRVVMGGGNRSSKLVLHPKELLKLPGVRIVEGLATAREQ